LLVSELHNYKKIKKHTYELEASLDFEIFKLIGLSNEEIIFIESCT